MYLNLDHILEKYACCSCNAMIIEDDDRKTCSKCLLQFCEDCVNQVFNHFCCDKCLGEPK